MKIIDFHTHIYPDKIAGRAAGSIADFYQLDGDGLLGSVDTLLKLEKEAGAERAAVLPVAMKPSQAHHVNEFIQTTTQEHPELIPFGTVHAGMEDLCEEGEFLLQNGYRGIKIHPDMQHFAIDDLRLYPFYDMIQGKLPVLFHMGDSRFNYSNPVKLGIILKQFPKLKCIAAHLGGLGMYDIAYDNLYEHDCCLDISSVIRLSPKEEIVKWIRAYGAERMIFGTDFPLWNPVHEVETFLSLGLTERELDQIGHKTAESILALTE